MEPQFNYKNVYLFLLSLFGIILILSLLGQINSNFAGYYSIIGIIVCVVVWISDEKIIHEAGTIRNSGVYHPNIHDSKIHKILGKRITLMWSLLGVLGILFIFLLFLELII